MILIFESIFLVFIGSSRLLTFFCSMNSFIYLLHLFIYFYWCFITLSFMRCPIRPYILESYSIDIVFSFFLSPFLWFVICLYYFLFFFRIIILFLFFMYKGFQLLQWYNWYIISWLFFAFDLDSTKRWVGYYY